VWARQRTTHPINNLQTHLEDREIVDGYLRGDTNAYTTIVGWAQAVVKNHVWLAAISPDDVLSLTSEKVLNNLRDKKFKFESSLKTYVQRITRYTIIDLVRSYQRAEQLMTLSNIDLHEVETPQQIYENAEEALLFDKIFSLMGEKCRELWNLILVDDLTYKAIGAMFGKTESAIKSQMGRCREEAVKIYARLA
jgi:RNA polymerase sigma factor (sigma-70 family)